MTSQGKNKKASVSHLPVAWSDDMSRRETKRRGMTIVEIVVAVGILTLGVAAICEQISASGKLARLIERQARRDLLANKQLNQLLAAPYDRLATWQPPTPPEPAPGDATLLWKASLSRQPDGLLRVSVTAGWPDPAKPKPGDFAVGSTFTVEGAKAP
jgi:type II secretory pathway pseudopilin PulG